MIIASTTGTAVTGNKKSYYEYSAQSLPDTGCFFQIPHHLARLLINTATTNLLNCPLKSVKNEPATLAPSECIMLRNSYKFWKSSILHGTLSISRSAYSSIVRSDKNFGGALGIDAAPEAT